MEDTLSQRVGKMYSIPNLPNRTLRQKREQKRNINEVVMAGQQHHFLQTLFKCFPWCSWESSPGMMVETLQGDGTQGHAITVGEPWSKQLRLVSEPRRPVQF